MRFLSVLIEYNVTPTPESVSVSFPVLLPIYNDCCISSTFIHIFFHFRHFSTNLPWAICELFLRARAGCVTGTGTLTHVLRKKAHPQLGGCAFLLYMKSESSMLVFPTEKHRHSGEAETASPVNGNRESGYAETASKIMLTG